MEYLMTYGWAILIIAVVLGALFSLGVFSSGALLGTSCVAGPGYLCNNIVLGTSGTLSFTLGQSTGSTFYNIALGCAAASLTTGLPNTGSTANSITLVSSTGVDTTNGMGASQGAATSTSMTSGQTLAISSLPCYGTTGTALGSSAIGTSFSGSVWLNYTLSSGVPSSSNPALTVKFATVTAKVS